MSDEARRWAVASMKAGDLLSKWFWKHPRILKTIAPKLPEIIDVLKAADIQKIEVLLEHGWKQ